MIEAREERKADQPTRKKEKKGGGRRRSRKKKRSHLRLNPGKGANNTGGANSHLATYPVDHRCLPSTQTILFPLYNRPFGVAG